MLCYFFFLVAVLIVVMICIVELGPKEELEENGVGIIVDDSMMIGHIYMRTSQQFFTLGI